MLNLRSVAKALALRGLYTLDQCASFGLDEVHLWSSVPADRALLTKVVMAAKVQATSDFAQAISDASSPLNVPGVKRARFDVGAYADTLTEETMSLTSSSQDVLALAGVPTSGEELGPRATVKQLTTAINGGKLSAAEVRQALIDKVRGQTLQAKSRSLGTLKSALRAWHVFAVAILGYLSSQSFPPKCVEDVLSFRALFRCPGTASNYIGQLRWLSDFLGFTKEWDGPMLKITMKATAVIHLRAVSGLLKVKCLMTWEMIQKAVTVLDQKVETEMVSILLLIGWAFLGRMQSEVFPLQAGTSEYALTLPPHLHSALYVDAEGSVVIRWRRRKHRPYGSILKRPCTCKKVSAKFCMAHRVKVFLERNSIRPGERLFPLLKPVATLKLVIRSLLLLSVPAAQHLTWKSIRAGHATHLAASGATLATILEAGEWRSAAFLSYIDSNIADAAEVLRQTLQSELDEASDAEDNIGGSSGEI